MGRKSDGHARCRLCETATFCFLFITLVITLLGLSVTKIIVGAIHLHDCSIEDRIPIWLIVSGCAPILLGVLERQSDEDSLCGTICGAIGFLFNFAWLICGSLWIYPIFGKEMAGDFLICHGNVTTECTNGDCNKSLITFAFSMVTVDWIFIVFWVFVAGYLLISYNMPKQSNGDT